jgi:hypothetical protein
MLINTSLSPETAARGLPNSRAADAPPASAGASRQTSGAEAALDRLQARFPLQDDGIPAIASAADADQVTEFLRANLLSQPGTALAAQSNPNPESAYNLLI